MVLLLACASPPPAPTPTSSAPAATAPEAAVAPREPKARATRGPPNKPPEIASIELTPGTLHVGDGVLAIPKVSDPEHQDITLEYQWTINGAPVLDVTRERLPSGRIVKGDTVAVKVTASDGTDTSELTSAPVKVENSAPVFKTGARDVKSLDGFQFSAEDPDGDALTWRVEGQPAGMSISNKGRLSYQGTEDEPGGAYKVAVVVEDGDAYGRFELPVTVSPGSKAPTEPKKR